RAAALNHSATCRQMLISPQPAYFGNILAATDLAFQSFAHSFTWCRQARTRLQLNCRASEERDVADSPAKRVVDRVDSSANGASENILRGTACTRPSSSANRDDRDYIQAHD